VAGPNESVALVKIQPRWFLLGGFRWAESRGGV
jgi:flagellar biogenesis protein FliO